MNKQRCYIYSSSIFYFSLASLGAITHSGRRESFIKDIWEAKSSNRPEGQAVSGVETESSATDKSWRGTLDSRAHKNSQFPQLRMRRSQQRASVRLVASVWTPPADRILRPECRSSYLTPPSRCILMIVHLPRNGLSKGEVHP